MSELKPCIRCGGHMSWNDNEFESAYVCDDCHYFVEWDGTPEEFVKWWNTRPIEDALTARIAELEYQLEDWTNNGWAEDYKARIAELEHRNKVLEDACEMLRKQNGRVIQLLYFWKSLSTNGSKVQQ